MINIKIIIDDCEVVGALCNSGETVEIEVVELSREFGYEEGKAYVDELYKDPIYKPANYSVSHFLHEEDETW